MTFKRIAPWLLSTLLLAAVLVWWFRSGHASANGPVAFRTATLQRGEVTQSVTGSGALSAITTVEVGTQVSGKIIRLHVDYNNAVKKEQLIAEVDPTSYQAKLVQAEADLLSARATLQLRQLNARRSAELLAKNLVSQSDYDTAEAELRQQEATTKKAEAAVNNARLDVEHCRITSPIDGVVLERSVDAGQTVQSSMTAPTLYKLAQDLRQMQITANISEADIGNVDKGQQVAFTVDAFPGRAFTGTVREVRNNSTTSNNVVTYPTIITVDNSDLKLRPGMTANVTITTARRSGVLRVPNAALRYRPPEGAIVRAESSGENSKSTAAATAGEGEGPGEPPAGGPDIDRMPAEIRERMLADFDKNGDGKLDDSEKTASRETMRTRFASGEGPMGGPPPDMSGQDGERPAGARPRRSSSSSATTSQVKTVYLLASPVTTNGRTTGELAPMRVVTGLADSTHTEIISGLKEGDVIVLSTLTTKAAASSTSSPSSGTTNPFAPARPPGGGAGGPPPPR